MSPEMERPGADDAAARPAAPDAADEAAPSIELRALYEQFARAASIAERQAIWNAIVAHQRGREVRVGTEATQAREAVLERHQRRRLWPF
ncbi:MAG TPA: hypothetical protein VFE37_02360 [Chloroflexota bacterium]|nr:hypothetical protein [Chloroflexota bacterium]